MPTTQWFRDRIAALELQVTQLQAQLVEAQAGVESEAEQVAELLAQERVAAVLVQLEQVRQELQQARDALDDVT
jgi:hypothetical protein